MGQLGNFGKRLSLDLTAKSSGYPPDDQAAYRSRGQNWGHRLRDDSVGKAQKDAEEQPRTKAKAAEYCRLRIPGRSER